jgi:hypothetical protein
MSALIFAFSFLFISPQMEPTTSAANGSKTRVQPRVVNDQALPDSSGDGARPDSRLKRDISRYRPTLSSRAERAGAITALKM